MECSLCTDPETIDNLIFTCLKCSVKVHALCYGIEDPESTWLCSPCEKNVSGSIICELCHQNDGAFKPTSCGKWCHAICALFTEGVRFEDETKMEPINISRISKSKRNKECSFCTQKKGFCGLCSKHNCPNRIHITCAQQNKCLQEVKNDSDDSLKFRAYCLEHKPKDLKRLSLGFVRKMVNRKNKKEKELKNAQSSHMNANWLMKTASEHMDNALETVGEHVVQPEEATGAKPKSSNKGQHQKKNFASTSISATTILSPRTNKTTDTSKGMMHT